MEPQSDGDRKTFTFSEAVTVKSGTYTELRLRKPKGRDLRTLTTVSEARGSTAGYFDVIANLAEVPVDVLDEAPLQDCRAMIAWVDGFFAAQAA
ncbi:phage tail assembly protein [Phreatobacter sp. HK31-P]